MKRRTFLTAAGTIGAVSIASSATVVSSVYNNVSTSILLEEFDSTSKGALDKFITDINENAESLDLDSSFAKRLAMPVQIIKKDKQNITYKNKAGQTISISSKDGIGKLILLQTA
jgi:hypothetical protein